jgi:putative FmdB family regulatory protein
MPLYEYRHRQGGCAAGEVFEIRQAVADEPLTRCPYCQAPVKRIISRINFSVPKTNSELRDLGFTKLVRRDDGVYENVTRRGNESRYFEAGKPETAPDLSRIISD